VTLKAKSRRKQQEAQAALESLQATLASTPQRHEDATRGEAYRWGDAGLPEQISRQEAAVTGGGAEQGKVVAETETMVQRRMRHCPGQLEGWVRPAGDRGLGWISGVSGGVSSSAGPAEEGSCWSDSPPCKRRSFKLQPKSHSNWRDALMAEHRSKQRGKIDSALQSLVKVLSSVNGPPTTP
jgi:hypothetical protein